MKNSNIGLALFAVVIRIIRSIIVVGENAYLRYAGPEEFRYQPACEIG